MHRFCKWVDAYNVTEEGAGSVPELSSAGKADMCCSLFALSHLVVHFTFLVQGKVRL